MSFTNTLCGLLHDKETAEFVVGVKGNIHRVRGVVVSYTYPSRDLTIKVRDENGKNTYAMRGTFARYY